MISPWSSLNTNWGHPWHRMCSYLGTFPACLSRTLIELLSDPGDVIMDPFSGRGTTILEARLSGRSALGSDLNPIAVALSRAKASTTSLEVCKQRIGELERKYDAFLYLPEAHVQSDDIQLIYSPRTLAQLCYLRRELSNSLNDTDKFLIGVVLGIMHGKERNDGSSAYASISMPNTFSMSPAYVQKYVETRILNRTSRNVFNLLRHKTERLFSIKPPAQLEYVVNSSDVKSLSTNKSFSSYLGKVKLIITSPPYLGVVNYAKQNWIRNWFLELDPNFESGEDLDDELTLEKWLSFADTAIGELKPFLTPDGVIAFVVGDVSKPTGGFVSLARELIQRIQHQNMFNYVGCIVDDIESANKTTRIWKETRGNATNIDRVVLMSDKQPSFNYDQLVTSIGSDFNTEPHVLDPQEIREYAQRFSSVSTR